MAISRRLRFEILRRDSYTCRYCGAKAPDVELQVDHVIPTALGGGDEPSNLVTSCTDCNQGKSSTAADAPIVDDVDATAMLFARAVEVATQRRQAEIARMEGFHEAFLKHWTDVVGSDPEEHWGFYGGSWKTSLDKFLAQGLTEQDLLRIARITGESCPRKPWNYFAGICWREIGDRQEEARRLIEDGQV